MTGLFSTQVITSDIWEAAVHTPFRFHPVRDKVFYEDIYWRVPHIKRIEAGEILINRFDRWYKHRATDMEKIHLVVAALTDSNDAIGLAIDSIAESLVMQQWRQSDGIDNCTPDWTHEVQHDPVLVRRALKTDKIEWWCRQFEKQAQRVLEAPSVPFSDYLKWTAERRHQQSQIKQYFRNDPFLANDVSIRKGRKIVKRSVELFAAWFGNRAVIPFLRGTPLKIRGHYFEWVVRLEPRHFVAKTVKPPRAHVPYELYLHNLDGEMLAKACVVFENAAVLDQAVGLGLSISTPECELDLLRATNVFAITEAGYQHDVLASVKQLTRPNPLDIAIDDITAPPTAPWTIETTDENCDDIAGELDQGTIDAYRQMLREQRNNPTANMIREELFRTLDVRPDLLMYMSAPECPMVFVGRMKKWPQMLRGFIENKVPLVLNKNTG